MDRFIESELSVRHHKKSYLKSNMDRFIVVFVILHNLINIIYNPIWIDLQIATDFPAHLIVNLKSNMDRFID